jgi:hypothetical protein
MVLMDHCPNSGAPRGSWRRTHASLAHMVLMVCPYLTAYRLHMAYHQSSLLGSNINASITRFSQFAIVDYVAPIN